MMSSYFQSVFENSKRELNFSKVKNFSEVVGNASIFRFIFSSSKSSVKLHSETGTMIGTLPLRQALRLRIWML